MQKLSYEAGYIYSLALLISYTLLPGQQHSLQDFLEREPDGLWTGLRLS